MNRRLMVLIVATALGTTAADAGATLLRGNVVANGGNPSAGSTNATHRLYGTAGQAAVGRSGNATHILCHGFWCFGGSRVVDVEPPPGGPNLPSELSFSQPRPNPARNNVSFELALPKAASVHLALYDLQGRRVLTMVDGPVEAGYHVVRWDGSDGATGGSGVYFARLLVDGRPFAQRRIVMLR